MSRQKGRIAQGSSTVVFMVLMSIGAPLLAGLTQAGNQFWTEADPGVPGIEWPNNHFGSSLAEGDFDCDGFKDLAIGIPYEDRPGISNSGAVVVLFGHQNGLASGRAQILDQGMPGVADEYENGDQFGFSLAAGDFDNSNCDDLAIGVPGESFDGLQSAGVVQILYGFSGIGLFGAGSQYFQQSNGNFPDTAESYDFFGYSLATGDFNGDSYDDLVIGTPLEDLTAGQNVGMITVVFGGAGGLAESTAVGFHQDSLGIPGGAEAEDKFGSSLASADFNGDGHDDLAVGVPFEGLVAGEDAGQVTVMYGSVLGIDGLGSQMWHLDQPGVAGVAQGNGLFGFAVTTGDFNNDGYSDLAAGAPGMKPGGQTDAGSVATLHGSAAGITASGSQHIHQDTAGMMDSAEAGDKFGYKLASGDFDGDGHDDLAVGVAFESIAGATSAGAVQELHGSMGGLTITGNQFWHQDFEGILDTAEPDDFFGRALAVGDFNGDGLADLAVGVTNETIAGDIQGAGAVSVLYATDSSVGRFSGTIIDHASGLPLADHKVYVHDSFGALACSSGSTTSNNEGVYSSCSLEPGIYYAKVFSTEYLTELYDDIDCPYFNCDVTTGTPIHVYAGYVNPGHNFALVKGGSIGGTITDETTGEPITDFLIRIHDGVGNFVTNGNVDSNGQYRSFYALPGGTYWARTNNTAGYLDEVYDNIPCPPPCEQVFGTPILVPLGTDVTGIDFALRKRGSISGTITDEATGLPVVAAVQIYDTSGEWVTTGWSDETGLYRSAAGLVSGTYYAWTLNHQGYIEEVYDNIQCDPPGNNCNPTAGTPISVTDGYDTSGIDFALMKGGTISGAVTLEDVEPGFPFTIRVDIFDSAGRWVGRGFTPHGGGAFTSQQGLLTGIYTAKTWNAGGMTDQMFDGIDCTSECNVTAGTPISVTFGLDTPNIDFVLGYGVFSDGFESGDTSAWSNSAP